MMRRWLEDAEVLEVGEERERDLRAHVRDHQLSHDESQVFDGPSATRAASATKPRTWLEPIPREPPVTITVRLSKRPMIFPLSCAVFDGHRRANARASRATGKIQIS